MADQYDLFSKPPSAQDKKEEALSRVSDHAGRWMDKCLTFIGQLAAANPHKEMTGEGVREVTEAYIGPPHHHNAWGAAIRMAVRRGYLKPTGVWVPMRGPKSNARRTPQYKLIPHGG